MAEVGEKIDLKVLLAFKSLCCGHIQSSHVEEVMDTDRLVQPDQARVGRAIGAGTNSGLQPM